jgi:transposase-like protein
MNTQIVLRGRCRTRRTVEQRRELVAGFRASGLGKAEYCREHGVNLGTFSQWLYSGRGLGGVRGDRAKKHRFAEVQLAVNGHAALEIELPTGIRLRVQDAALLSAVSGFIRELSAC